MADPPIPPEPPPYVPATTDEAVLAIITAAADAEPDNTSFLRWAKKNEGEQVFARDPAGTKISFIVPSKADLQLLNPERFVDNEATQAQRLAILAAVERDEDEASPDYGQLVYPTPVTPVVDALVELADALAEVKAVLPAGYPDRQAIIEAAGLAHLRLNGGRDNL